MLVPEAYDGLDFGLKGMGALSDAEGNKLLAAVGALNPKMGEKAFQDSLLNIQANLNRAKESLQKRTADLYRNRVTPGQKTIPISPTLKKKGASEMSDEELLKALGG